MAKLKDIVAGILQEITQARSLSDTYSRDLRAEYQKDPFLKLLAVPRTDITEVTLDLKFAVIQPETPIVSDPDITKLNPQHVQYLEVGDASSKLLAILRRRSPSEWQLISYDEGVFKAGSFVKRGSGYFSHKLELNPTGEEQRYLDIDFSAQKVMWFHQNSSRSDEYDHDSGEPVYKILRASTNLLPESTPRDAIEVEVVAEQLAKVPESAISSMSIKLDMTRI